jgi:hypothetical protein
MRFQDNTNFALIEVLVWTSAIVLLTNPALVVVTAYLPLGSLNVTDPSMPVCETSVAKSLLKTISQSGIRSPNSSNTVIFISERRDNLSVANGNV